MSVDIIRFSVLAGHGAKSVPVQSYAAAVMTMAIIKPPRTTRTASKRM